MQKKPDKNNYGIYCLYHDRVLPEYYGSQIDDITFVKKGDSPYLFHAKKHIHLSKTPYFSPIGIEWVDYDFYYSLYKGYLSGLVKLPEYLGFIHYDMELKSKDPKHKNLSVVDFIAQLEKKKILKKDTIISFCPFDFEEIWDQHFIMDPKRPELFADPKFENCLETMTNEYNILEKGSLKTSTLFKNRLDMCNSFLIHRDVFIKLLAFMSIIIEDGRLSVYSKEKRRQAHLAERYAAIFLQGENLKRIEFPLIHHNVATIDELDPLNRAFVKFKGHIKTNFPVIHKPLKKIKCKIAPRKY
jgi:hypothetical protein